MLMMRHRGAEIKHEGLQKIPLFLIVIVYVILIAYRAESVRANVSSADPGVAFGRQEGRNAEGGASRRRRQEKRDVAIASHRKLTAGVSCWERTVMGGALAKNAFGA